MLETIIILAALAALHSQSVSAFSTPVSTINLIILFVNPFLPLFISQRINTIQTFSPEIDKTRYHILQNIITCIRAHLLVSKKSRFIFFGAAVSMFLPLERVPGSGVDSHSRHPTDADFLYYITFCWPSVRMFDAPDLKNLIWAYVEKGPGIDSRKSPKGR
jgi:hypothetical protein